MNISMVLIPVDFSECAVSALNFAKQMFVNRKKGVDLVLIHVVDSKTAMDIARYVKEPVEEVKERLINQARQTFRKFLKENGVSDLVKDTIVSFGPPFQEIAIKARELQPDLVLMGGYGSRGKGQIDEIFFGSTVEKVVRLLPCPVLCVPMDWDAGVSS